MPNFISHHPRPHQTPLLTTPHHHPPSTLSRCSTNFPPSIRPPKPFTMLIPPHQITTRTNARTRVICMANPRRVKMVARQIQRELSDMLITDEVVKAAVLPEAGFGADRYLSSVTSISDVEITKDLQVARVYVSVFGDERGKEVAISGLKAKAKYVRAQLGRRMRLRLTPEIRFIEDVSIERGSRVLAILDELKKERKVAKPQADNHESSDMNEEEEEEEDEDEDEDDDEDWEVDDPDEEDIIYVK